jgi:excisionase family DNA binding protein
MQKNYMPKEGFYTLPELMEILKCSRYHIMCLIKAKKIKGFKVGKVWRFSKQSVESLNKISDDVECKPTVFVLQRKRGRKIQ